MFHGIAAHGLVRVSVVYVLPQQPGSFAISTLSTHSSRHQSEKGMGIRKARAALEGLSRGDVIMTVHVMDETEIEVLTPVVWKFIDAALYKPNRQVWAASTLRRLLRKKNRAEPVSRLEFGIEGHGYIQERIQQVVLFRAGEMMVAEILYGPQPVQVGQQAAITEAHPLHGLRGRNEKHLGKSGMFSELDNTQQG